MAASPLLAFDASRWHPLRFPSVRAARCFDDGTLDSMFLDGEHSDAAVQADLAAWSPKVRPGALITGHDFDPSVSQVYAKPSARGTRQMAGR